MTNQWEVEFREKLNDLCLLYQAWSEGHGQPGQLQKKREEIVNFVHEIQWAVEIRITDLAEVQQTLNALKSEVKALKNQ